MKKIEKSIRLMDTETRINCPTSRFLKKEEIKNKTDVASQELQKIGPLAAGLLAYGAGKILSSNKESARKTKNKTITKAHEFVGWVQKSDPMTRVPHLLKENCPCESCFQKNSDFKGTIEREVNNYFA